jgi:hypothetical protein
VCRSPIGDWVRTAAVLGLQTIIRGGDETVASVIVDDAVRVYQGLGPIR